MQQDILGDNYFPCITTFTLSHRGLAMSLPVIGAATYTDVIALHHLPWSNTSPPSIPNASLPSSIFKNDPSLSASLFS